MMALCKLGQKQKKKNEYGNSLHGLINDREGGLIDIEHGLAFGALCSQVVILLEQVIEEILLVKSRHQTVLYCLTRVVYQQVHDGLWDKVLDRFTGDTEVRYDQRTYTGTNIRQGDQSVC